MRKKQGFQWKRAFGTTIFIIVSIILLDTIRRSIVGDSIGQINVLGNFRNPNISEPTKSTVVVNTDTSEITDLDKAIEEPTDDENIISLSSSTDLGKGSLALINNQYISQTFYNDVCDLSLNKNEYYDTFESSSIFISSDAVPYLNEMMQDYFEETQKDNMIIYSSDTENSLYSTNYAESTIGYSFDLAVMSSYNEVIQYDGMDTESWITENCYKYGFVLRYPQDKEEQTGVEYSPYHFRYVGIPHSFIMNEKNMCLEEYITFLKDYTAENPLVYTIDDTDYNIYYVESTTPLTEISIEGLSDYEISGNNCDGYIITYVN